MEKKYYLGLDLGISSVGWAVMAEENGQYYIDDFGVRLFDCSEEPKYGTTNAEARRIFRSAKRLNRRRKQRISDLKFFLANNQIINQQEIKLFFDNHKITNNIQYDDQKYFNPYVLRVKGLKSQLTEQELAVVLINIANRRGYNDKFSFDSNDSNKKEDSKSKLDNSISKADALVKTHYTIAQAILTDQDFKNQNNLNTLGLIRNKVSKKDEKSKYNYRYLFSRQDYKKELALILNCQKQFYPQLNDTNIKYVINDIILRQRDFEDGPGPNNDQKYAAWAAKIKKHRFYQSFLKSEGNCRFYKEEARGYRSSLTFEIFQMVSALSTFTVRNLQAEEIKTVANIIFDTIKNGDIPDKTKIKKIIIDNSECTNETFTNSNAWKNKEMKISFNYLKFLLTLFPNQFKDIEFNNLSNHFFNKLGKVLHENITPERRKLKLIDFFKENSINLLDSQIDEFLQLQKKSINVSTCNASFKYMEAAIAAFAEGISYGQFQADFNKKHEHEIFKFDIKGTKIFQPIKDSDMAKNAVVFRAINQARKIINALHKEYKCFFEVINVEVARELAKSFDERKEIKKQNDVRYEKRLRIEETLKKYDIVPNDVNVKKYNLWIEQNKRCIYCQDHHEIIIEEIGMSGALQLDHIIPQSVISDDTLNNLVLVCDKANQQKKNRTPLQWMSENPEQEKSFRTFCNKLKNNLSEKKYQYLITKDIDDETLAGFQSRNLNDTRYITRYIVNWLELEFKNWTLKTGEIVPTIVQSITGAVTSRFRRIWLRDNAWGLDQKVRDITPYHHAVDAIILTQFISFSYVSFASDIANISNLKRLRNKNKIDNDTYLNNCKEILTKWTVNKKVYVPDAVKKLERIIYSDKTKGRIMSPLVGNLLEFIETRIPVELELVEVEKEFLIKNEKNVENQIPDKTVTRPVKTPRFKTVLNQEEYAEKLKKLNTSFHYPFISYKVDYKLSGKLTSSQMPVNHKFELKKNQDGVKEKQKINLYEAGKLKDSYFQDKKGTIWKVDKYYGAVIKFKNNKIKPEWIRRINATKENLISFKDYDILVKRNIVEYYDKKQAKKIIKLFNGKQSSQIYANLLGTVNIQDIKKNPQIFGFQNYYDSISNWSQDFKILQPNILGKLVTK